VCAEVDHSSCLLCLQPSWWIPALKALVVFTMMVTLDILSGVVSCTVAGTFGQVSLMQQQKGVHGVLKAGCIVAVDASCDCSC
jgi:hypothetical protein